MRENFTSFLKNLILYDFSQATECHLLGIILFKFFIYIYQVCDHMQTFGSF